MCLFLEKNLFIDNKVFQTLIITLDFYSSVFDE